MPPETEPPPKKQKVTPSEPPKRKPPQHINLRLPLTEETLKAQKPQIDTLLKLLRKKKKIVVIAGAGISVGAGIPDFRSSAGLFSSLRSDMKLKTSGKELFDASVYKDDKLTSSFHEMVRNLHSMTTQATPTLFHHLLATLATQGRLLRLYSQNVDCIDTQLEPLKTIVPLGNKGPWPRTIQLHGGLEKMVCSKCGWLAEFEASLFRGSEPPDCSECLEMDCVRGIAGKRALGVGKLRPRIVLYNEFNPDAEAIGAVTRADLKSRPDCLIVVGTSLKVPGVRRIVREMCGVVQDYRGGMTVWINEDSPPLGRDFEGVFDLIVAKMASFPRWDGSEPQPEIETDSDSCGSFLELDPDEPPRDSSAVEVHVPQLLSPSISPHPKIAKPMKNAKKRPAPEPKAEPAAKKSKAKAKPGPKTTATKSKVKVDAQKPGPIATAFKSVKKVVAKPAKARVRSPKEKPPATKATTPPKTRKPTAAAVAKAAEVLASHNASATAASVEIAKVIEVPAPMEVILPLTPPAPSTPVPIPERSTAFDRPSPTITIASLLN
ncbi:DHS-like NAD/FAD-binding domain-containing protein [Choiromyces venosus 120613-1]|uniref:DHS-like NAD/FAD-binding domain-containing protein n=1 Tax=Choiromyces venosus 120613-1 TaxID=1336337 RepID=A0A3N4JE81_9PEZI|nr:DHS-like NAD/FAD-binding domain-containing protein [Choiromyces venosus 120613-1]